MPTTQRDYYEVLEVERSASQEEVKRAYRKMAMRHHPDRNPGDDEAETRFKEAAEAYEVLSDEDKRRRYDRHGHAGVRGGGGHDFSHMDVGDIFSVFEEIFGGGGGLGGSPFGGGVGGGMGGGRAGNGRATRGYDLETSVEVTLEEVARGAEREVDFTRQDLCDGCGGTGAPPGSEPTVCSTCGGRGQVAQSGLGGMFRMVVTCPTCRGAGRLLRDKCKQCRGSGRQAKEVTVHVDIPAGIRDGQAIRVPGEGEPGPVSPGGVLGVPGDLLVVARVAEHPLFVRDGDDLILRMPVSYPQLALGATVKVPTLDGEETVTIAPGTQGGELSRIRGGGLPHLRSGRRGDLIVQLLLEVPRDLSDKQRELLRQYAETQDREVLPETKSFWQKIKEHLS